MDLPISDIDITDTFIVSDMDQFKAELLYESYFVWIILATCCMHVAITMQMRNEIDPNVNYHIQISEYGRNYEND